MDITPSERAAVAALPRPAEPAAVVRVEPTDARMRRFGLVIARLTDMDGAWAVVAAFEDGARGVLANPAGPAHGDPTLFDSCEAALAAAFTLRMTLENRLVRPLD